jgi:transcriptional regulator with XRE-family HTH domain
MLSAARSRTAPEEVGLPVGRRRRVPGLRREEVAQLAGVSVDYVVRLEQGRGPQPSEQVLGALTRALRLDTDQRDQLFRLAGSAPPLPGRIEMSVRPSVLRLMERMSDLPTLVLSAKGDVLAQNALSAALVGDLLHLPARQRNIVWQRFLGTQDRVAMTADEQQATAQQSVGTLKMASARYPDDPDLAALITELTTASPRFAQLWAESTSTRWRNMRKSIRHPEIGLITLDCDTLMLPDTDQSMIVYSAAAGSPEATALALLRVTGTERMSSAVTATSRAAE